MTGKNESGAEHINAGVSVGSRDSVDRKDDLAGVQEAELLAANWAEGSEAEKKLVRKLDWRILPCTWVLYLLGYLDRANISNAKTGGLEDDFGLTDSQYSIIVLIFFVSYLIFEVPANMVLTRVKPSVFLPGLGLLWGTFATLMAATTNWSHLVGLRFLLGFAEAGFAPGCAFYLSSWYRKYELSTRYALLYTSVPLAGAFSGLLAGVFTEYLDGAGGIAGWRWLFIIEGLLSIVASIFIYFLMPNFPSNSKRFLKENETILACHRLIVDGIALTQGADEERISHWHVFKMTVSDWRVWCQCFLFVLITGAQTMQYFIPTLVKSFGWSSHSGQYHTIPFYAAALVYVVACCYLSDKFKTKWQFVCGLATIGAVLFIAVVTSYNLTVQYVLSIFAFGTIYGCSPLVKTWVADVIPQPAAKRAVAIALINAIGNASSIYSTWLWPSSDAPRYVVGFAVTTSWLGAVAIGAPIFAYFFRKYPAQRAEQHETLARELRAREKRESGKTKV